MAEALRVPRIKVCGMTRVEDVEVAISTGADAIGLVHHPASPRHLEAEAAERLTRSLPDGMLAVAVLVEAEPAAAATWARSAGAHVVQLCGAQRAADWRDFELPILRRVAVDERAEEEFDAWLDVAMAFVLDHPGAPGGTGLGVDLERAAALAARAPALLAGGLDEHNVTEAVRRVQPFGVDASSRLESGAGMKDSQRVRAFVRAARAALAARKDPVR
jgi:phosphoribosylanthranilate isomerase